MKSYFSLFRNYANFSGFMKRGAYWTAMIIHWLILLIPLIPGIFFMLNKNDLLPAVLNIADPASVISKIYLPWVLPIWCFYYLLMIIPVWSATVRRLHSLPKSGWWLLLGLIPVIAYGLLYLYKVIYAPEEKRWPDFYGFNRNGKWKISFICMAAAAFLISLALYAR